MSRTVEIVIFSLKPGVQTEVFLRAAEAVTLELSAMPGFLNRELSHDGERWVDYIHWASLEQAQAASQALLGRPAAQPFIEMIDPASALMLHTRPVVDSGA